MALRVCGYTGVGCYMAQRHVEYSRFLQLDPRSTQHPCSHRHVEYSRECWVLHGSSCRKRHSVQERTGVAAGLQLQGKLKKVWSRGWTLGWRWGKHLRDELLGSGEGDDGCPEGLAEEREAWPGVRAEEAGVGQGHGRDVRGDGEAKLLRDRLLEHARVDRMLRVDVYLHQHSSSCMRRG